MVWKAYTHFRCVRSIALLSLSGSVFSIAITAIMDSLTIFQALYVFSTLICGFTVWVDLRKRIQNARIESVMKVE